MKRIIFLVSLLLFYPYCLAAEQLASGTILMEFDLSEQNAKEKVDLWVPYPTSDDDQLVTNISVKGDFAESAVYSDEKYSTPMLYAKWDASSKSRNLVLKFHVTRKEVIKKDFPKNELTLNASDYKMYLEPSRNVPIDGMVKDLAEEITQGQTTIYGKAKAIYDWICVNMYRDPNVKGCGAGDVRLLLLTPGGKCTDIHSVFVALCRAVGVPSREVLGLRQSKKDVADITTHQHCWAEFFLPGYGWVPVDPADVRKMMLKHKLSLTDPKTKEYRDYFWGGWDPYRVKLAMGRDIILNPKQQGEPLNTFGYPYAEVDGEPVDWLEPKTFKYKITYTKDTK